MIFFKRLGVLFFCFLVLGCATRIFHSPAIDLTLKDFQTKIPIKSVELFNLDLYRYLSKPKVWVANSNSKGELLVNANSELKLHPPIPIISGGGRNITLFELIHPEYNIYKFSCFYNNLHGGDCLPIIKKMTSDKKDMAFECKNCCVFNSIKGSIKKIETHGKREFEFTTHPDYKNNTEAKFYKTKMPFTMKLNEKKLNENNSINVDVLSQGSCRNTIMLDALNYYYDFP